MLRYDYPFRAIPSSEPAFNVALSQSAVLTKLESTERVWQGPSGRSIRLSETSGVDYFIALGSSLVAAVSTASMQILGGVAEVFRVDPSDTYISVITAATSTHTVNVTLGYGR